MYYRIVLTILMLGLLSSSVLPMEYNAPDNNQEEQKTPSSSDVKKQKELFTCMAKKIETDKELRSLIYAWGKTFIKQQTNSFAKKYFLTMVKGYNDPQKLDTCNLKKC